LRDDRRVNEQLLDGINSIAGEFGPLDSAIRFFAGDGLYVLGAIALLFGLLEFRSSFPRGVQVGTAMVIAAALAGVMLLVSGALITETRPFVHDQDTVLLISHGADNSFPSEHALGAAAIAGVASLAWRRWAVVYVGLAFLVGFARVAAGVHYPGDVLASWLIGAFAAMAGWYIAPAILNAGRGLRGEAPA
jgi:undecaprenyl-diphosphatase